MRALIVRKCCYLAVMTLSTNLFSYIPGSNPACPSARATMLDYRPHAKIGERRVLIGAVLASRESSTLKPPGETPKLRFLPPLSRRDESLMLAKALEALRAGDVSGARTIYGYLAAKGSARGARGVGDTFNPLILRSLPNAGLAGDALMASFWYGKAAAIENESARASVSPKAAGP